MKKIAFHLAGAGVFAAVALGLATPAFAATDTTVQPVDCHVHVIYQGNPVDVAWC
jgi:hypothetical protein